MSATKSLPQKPSAEHLRKEAKSIARRSAIRLSTAQHRLAREYAYRNWTELILAVEMMAQSQGPDTSGSEGPPTPSAPPRADTGACVPVLPLRGLVAFPHDAYPIYVGRRTSIDAVTSARERGGAVLLVAQKDAQVGDAATAELYEVGTLAAILKVVELPDGTLKIIVEGQKRAHVKRVTFEKGFAEAEIEDVQEPRSSHRLERRRLVGQVLRHLRRQVGKSWVTKLGKPSEVADLVASQLEIEIADKQASLELTDPVERLHKILSHLGA